MKDACLKWGGEQPLVLGTPLPTFLLSCLEPGQLSFGTQSQSLAQSPSCHLGSGALDTYTGSIPGLRECSGWVTPQEPHKDWA